MATSGEVGAFFAPTIDDEGNIITSTITDNFTNDGGTEFTLSSEYIHPKKTEKILVIKYWDETTSREETDVVGDEADIIGTVDESGSTFINLLFQTNNEEFKVRMNFNYLLGEVKLSKPIPSEIEEFSITYVKIDELEQVGGFFEWEFGEEAKLEESTTFADDGITKNTSLLQEWDAVARQHYGVDDRFEDVVGDYMVVALYIDTETGKRFEGWGIIGNKELSCPINTLIEKSIYIQGQEKLYYRE